MDCFDNFIEVDGTCSDVTPTSGLFLSNIGITVDFLDQIVTKQYDNGVALANAKMDFARKTVFNRVLTHFSNRVKPFTMLESARIGHTQDDLIVQSGSAGKLKGIEIEFCNLNSFVDFHLSDLNLQLTSNGVIDVMVYDLLQGKLLDTIPITAVANNIVQVFPNKTYSSQRQKLHLLIAYDSTGLDSIQTSVDTNKKTCCGSELHRINQFVSARGTSIDTGDAKTKSNLDGESYTGGLSLNFSIECNMEKWLCTIKNNIALPVLYASGLEIIKHALDSAPNDRVNTTVNINRDILEKREERYQDDFENSINNVLNNIKLPTDRFCFICNERSRNTVILP